MLGKSRNKCIYGGKGLEPELCEVSKGRNAFIKKKVWNRLEPEICEVSKGRNAFMGKKVWNLKYVK